MSVNGVNGAGPGWARAYGAGSPQGAAAQGARPNARAETVVAGATAPVAGAQEKLPVEAPAGTDPALWSVLTTEEREFFARQASLGPITYGRVVGAPSAGVPRGGRLDLKI